MKWILSLIFLSSTFGQAESIHVEISPTGAGYSQWKPSQYERVTPYAKDSDRAAQARLNEQYSYQLNRDLCIPNQLCNFMKEGAKDRLRRDAQKEAHREVDGFGQVLTLEVSSKASELTSAKVQALGDLRKNIAIDVESYKSHFHSVHQPVAQNEAPKTEDLEKDKQTVNDWVQASNTVLLADEDIREDIRIQMEGYPYKTAIQTTEGQALLSAYRYKEFVRDHISKEDRYFREKNEIVDHAGYALDIADLYYLENNTEEGDSALSMATILLDLAVSFVPQLWAADLGRSIIESITGQNLLTGENLSELEHSLAVINVITIGFANKISKGLKVLGCLIKGKAVELIKTSEKILESAKKFGAFSAGDTKSYTGLVKKIGGHSSKDIVQFEKLKVGLTVEEIKGAKVIGSAMKEDVGHRSASYMLDIAAKEGKVTSIRGDYDGVVKNLLQVEGKLNGDKGIFEWIVSAKGLEHQRFIKGGRMTGFPNQNPNKIP